MSDTEKKTVTGLLVAALVLLVISFVLLLNATICGADEISVANSAQEVFIEPFRVRSKATAEVYTAVSASINEETDEMEIKIYNYYTDKYEWYPIYKFYKYAEIAAYIDEEYAETQFGKSNSNTDFIDFAKYDESEL